MICRLIGIEIRDSYYQEVHLGQEYLGKYYLLWQSIQEAFKAKNKKFIIGYKCIQEKIITINQSFHCIPLEEFVQLYFDANILIKLLLMSFFPQSERKTDFQLINTPAPTHYDTNSLSNSRRYACAPFGSTQPLTRISKQQKQKNSNPQRMNKDFQQVFSVNNMNIKIKPQEQPSSVFKSSTTRFERQVNQNQIPGPGQYVVEQTLQKKVKSLSHSHIVYPLTLPNKLHVPSIPVDNLGFKQDDNNEMKKVKPPEVQAPHPGSYDIARSLSAKGVLAWKQQKPIKKQPELLPGPGNYIQSIVPVKSINSCFKSVTDRFGNGKKLREQKIPGPGQYTIQSSKKMSHNMSSEGYFNSKTSRFDRQSKDNYAGPGMYFNELNPRNKSLSMNTIRKVAVKEDENNNKTVNRKTIFQTNNNNPGPGEYRTNFGISYQLHKALLRKQTTDVFPKQKRTVFDAKQEVYVPGPGYYEADINKKPRGKLWKKTQVINLKEQEQPSPSPIQYSNIYNTIQYKVKQMNSKLTLGEQKPFNSGAERFKHYPNSKPNISKTQDTQQQQDKQIIKTNQPKKVKRLVMTTIKVRVPFGVSSSKFQQKIQGYDGPDYINHQPQWVKPSFNIKSKLQ